MPHALEAVRAVHRGGFVKLGADPRQGGDVHNGFIARLLPYAAQYIQPGEQGFAAHKIDRGEAQAPYDGIDRAKPHVRDLHEDTHHDDRGNEVRRVRDHLHGLAELLGAAGIYREGENDGHGKTDEQVDQADPEGVPDDPRRVGRTEKLSEQLKPHPLASRDAQYGVPLFECDLDTVDGQVFENENVHQGQ